jgi:acylphosphatase
MKKSIRLYITGSVQGIFFRQFIKDHANKNNIKGYVRNLEDGRVEIFIEGNTEEVENMAQICKRGPNHAQIRKVEEKKESFQDFKEFKILRI